MHDHEKLSKEADDCLALMSFAFRNITDEADAELKKMGLNRSHHRILFFVRLTDGVPLQELLVLLGISRQALHRPLKKLQKLELVRLIPTKEDRRNHTVVLTKAGTELEFALTDPQRKLFQCICEKTGATGFRAWIEVMLHLAGDNIKIAEQLLRSECCRHHQT